MTLTALERPCLGSCRFTGQEQRRSASCPRPVILVGLLRLNILAAWPFLRLIWPIRFRFHFARFPRRLVPSLAFFLLARAAACAADAAPGVSSPGLSPPGARPAAASAAHPLLTGLPFLTSWGPDVYRAAPTNYRIVQHPQTGYIYVGNTSGLLEFDGATWRVMTLRNEGVVPIVVVDARGSVWMGGTNEVAVLRPDARGELLPVDVTDRLPAADRDLGRLYLGTAASDGVYLASPTRLVFFGHDGSARSWPSGPSNFNGLAWLDGSLYVSKANDGLFQLQNGALVAVAAPPRSPNPATKDTLRLFGARRLAGSGETLLLTDVGPMRWAGPGTPMVPLSAAASAIFAQENASAAAFLCDGRLAFSFAREGVHLLAADGAPVAKFTPAFGLPRGTVAHLAPDDQGGLWLAHVNQVTRLQIESRFSVQTSLDSARAFLRRGNRLYIAHFNGVSWRDDTTGDLHPIAGFPTGPGGLVSIGERIFATGQYLREITDDDRAVVALPFQFNHLTDVPRHPGTFVGASVRGLRLLGYDGAKWRDDGLLPGVPASVESVVPDESGFVWAAGYRGAGSWRVEFQSGPNLDVGVAYLDPACGLPFARGTDFATFWTLGKETITFRGGKVLRYDRAARRFVPEDRIDNLPLFNRAVVTSGDAGDQWWFVDTPAPLLIHIARTAENRWRADALPAGPLRGLGASRLYYDSPSKILWLGGREPPVTVDPAWRPEQPPSPLRAVIRTISTAAGEMLFGGGAPGVVPHAGDQRLRIDATRNSLRFSFAAPVFTPDYHGNIRTEYRSRLEGLEPGWSQWSATPWREFTDLPYRNFVFHVQARDVEGRESTIGTIAFSVLPPWWRTWWFMGLVGASSVAGIAGVSRWFATRALQRRVQLLESQSAVERERLRLARDLHDEVGSGLGRVILFVGEAARAKAEPEKLEASLARVRGAAQELVQHARQIVWAVSPQHDTLASVIERFGNYTVETLRAADIACAVDLPDVEKIPPIMLGAEVRHSLFLAVKEAVHNCVKYSETKTAELRLAIAGDEFVIMLRDHGRGFVVGEKLGSGHGTVNIIARAKVLGGRAEISSEVGQGTTVEMRVPLNRPLP